MGVQEQVDSVAELFIGKTFAHMATVMPDGLPQVTPVWIDRDGDFLLVVSYKGRVKDRNIRKNPKVGLEISDPEQPYRYVSVQGEVVGFREEGAEAQLDKLSLRYLGKPKYPWGKPDLVPVIYVIKPIRIHVHEAH